ncbi:MAG: hypothetical protein AAF170_15935 [Bacteroidota bacterium]
MERLPFHRVAAAAAAALPSEYKKVALPFAGLLERYGRYQSAEKMLVKPGLWDVMGLFNSSLEALGSRLTDLTLPTSELHGAPADDLYIALSQARHEFSRAAGLVWPFMSAESESDTVRGTTLTVGTRGRGLSVRLTFEVIGFELVRAARPEPKRGAARRALDAFDEVAERFGHSAERPRTAATMRLNRRRLIEGLVMDERLSGSEVWPPLDMAVPGYLDEPPWPWLLRAYGRHAKSLPPEAPVLVPKMPDQNPDPS